MSNYIPDENKFKLSGPPQWWLRQLWEFDNSLVVIPSRQGFQYRLAQRRPPSLAHSVINEGLFQQSDTQMLARYGLIPVTTIVATANWSNPLMFETLRRRAPWRMGGAEVVEQKIVAQEQTEALDKRKVADDYQDKLTTDGWNYYNMKRGVRSHMWSPKTPDRSRPTVQTPLIKIAS